MPLPRFRIRTLMIAVAVVAVATTVLLVIVRQATRDGPGWSSGSVIQFSLPCLFRPMERWPCPSPE